MPRVGEGEIPQGGGGGGGIWHLRLSDDAESATLWFLTEYEEFYWERFHRVEKPDGKYAGQKVCVASALGQECSFCDNGDNPRTEFLAWVYEMNHDFPSPTKGATATKINDGKRTVYRKQTNEVRLLRASVMHLESIKMRANRLGTLIDRPYEWIRGGEKGTTRPVYMLEPLDKEKMPGEIKALIASLPSLEDVAFGRVDQTDGRAAKSYGTRKVTPQVEEITVAEDDDEQENEANPFE